MGRNKGRERDEERYRDREKGREGKYLLGLEKVAVELADKVPFSLLILVGSDGGLKVPGVS